MIDLWPEDIGLAKPKAPVAILQEQAALLGQKTQNVVEATVKPQRLPALDRFRYAFNIKAGGLLGAYTYQLFSINHGIDLYPVLFYLDEDVATEVIDPGDGKGTKSIEIWSEEALIELLGKILKSEKTRRIISALLSQADYLEEEIPF